MLNKSMKKLEIRKICCPTFTPASNSVTDQSTMIERVTHLMWKYKDF